MNRLIVTMPFTILEATVGVGIPRAGHAIDMIPKGFPAASPFDGALVGLLVRKTWRNGPTELGGKVNGLHKGDSWATDVRCLVVWREGIRDHLRKRVPR